MKIRIVSVFIRSYLDVCILRMLPNKICFIEIERFDVNLIFSKIFAEIWNLVVLRLEIRVELKLFAGGFPAFAFGNVANNFRSV